MHIYYSTSNALYLHNISCSPDAPSRDMELTWPVGQLAAHQHTLRYLSLPYVTTRCVTLRRTE